MFEVSRCPESKNCGLNYICVRVCVVKFCCVCAPAQKRVRGTYINNEKSRLRSFNLSRSLENERDLKCKGLEISVRAQNGEGKL